MRFSWLDNLRNNFKGLFISNYFWVLIILLGLIFLYWKEIINISQPKIFTFSFLTVGMFFFFQGRSNNWVKYILPLYFVTSYYFWKFSIIKKISEDIKFENPNFNSPIDKIKDDKLNRKKIASRVFNIIKNTPVNDNLRIGIYGKWGEGKTSSMKMIEDLCVQEEFMTVWFNPWVYDNNSDYWLGLINSIENALIRYSEGRIFPTFIRNIQMSIYKLFNKALPKLTIGNVLKEIIFNKSSSIKDFHKKKINELIDNRIPKGKKIIIFIDDLDRVENKELQINLLMGLKELVDLNRFIFLIAIDDTVISNSVDAIIPSENGRKFLDKIIDFEIYLPVLTIEEKKRFIINVLKEINILKEEVVIDIAKFISSNPRNIKRFIYYLETLKPNLENFYDDELNWPFLYLAQMLSLEYPSILKYILTKEDYQEIFLQHFSLLSNENESTIDDEIKKLSDENINIKKEDKQRVRELLRGLIDYSSFMDKNELLTHFRLIEFPDYMSWKTFDNKYEEMNEKPGQFDLLDFEFQKEFIHKLLKKRDNLINSMISTIDEENMKKIKEKIISSGNHIEKILSRNENIEFKILETMFEQIYEQYNPKFNSSIYIEIREQEIELLYKIIKYDKSHSLDYLKIIKPRIASFQHFEEGDSIEEIINYLYKIIALDILEIFNKPQGIKNLMHNTGDNYIEIQLLLKESVSINKDNYEKIKALASKATENKIVHENFYDYFSWLVESAQTNKYIVDNQKSKELLLDKDFLQIIWEGVIAKVLNRRHLGTIDKEYWDYLKELYENNDKDLEEVIKKPGWWDKIIGEWEN